jgi:hypothetical protein
MQELKAASKEVQDKALRLIAEGRVIEHKRAVKVYSIFGDTGIYDVRLSVSWRRANSIRKIYDVYCPCKAHVICSHQLAALILAERDGYELSS